MKHDKIVSAKLLNPKLSHFSHVWLCVTPQTAAHQTPLFLGLSRQEHLSGLTFPSPMHESEKRKWNHSVMSNSSRPHGPQPTRLLHPWYFPGKSIGVGCHCLNLREVLLWLLKFSGCSSKLFLHRHVALIYLTYRSFSRNECIALKLGLKHSHAYLS